MVELIDDMRETSLYSLPIEPRLDVAYGVATGTVKKVYDFSVPLGKCKSEALFPLSQYYTFEIAPENGQAPKDNLEEKYEALAASVKPLLTPGPEQDEFLNTVERSGLYFKGGRAEALNRIVLMVDDTVLAFPKDLWEKIHEQVQHLSDELKYTDYRDRPGYVLVTALGPIVASVGGAHKFWNDIVRPTIMKDFPEYHNGVIIYNYVECAYRIMADEHADFERVTADNPLVFVPDGKYVNIKEKGYAYLESTEDYVRNFDDPELRLINSSEACCAEYWDQYSSRSTVLREIQKQLEAKLIRSANIDREFRMATARMTKASKEFNLVVVAAENAYLDPSQIKFPEGFDNINIRKIVIPSGNKTFEQVNPGETLLDAESLNFSFGHGDGFLIVAPEGMDQTQRDHFGLITNSIDVAKATDPTYRNAIVVWANVLGGLNRLLKLRLKKARGGMAKDDVLHPIHYGLRPNEQVVARKHVKHMSLLSGDILSSNSADATCDALAQLLPARMQNYRRIEMKPLGKVMCGMPIDHDATKTVRIAVFSSASTDQTKNLNNCKEVGKILGELSGETSSDIPVELVQGGGDRHGMGCVLAAFRRFRDPDNSFITLASTHNICKTEVKSGKLPDCDHGLLTDDIGSRIKILTDVDFCVSTCGGYGTLQEIYHARVMNKPILLVGEDALGEIECMFGKEAVEKIKNDPNALEKHKVWYFPDAKAAKPMIEKLYCESANVPYQPKPEAAPTTSVGRWQSHDSCADAFIANARPRTMRSQVDAVRYRR